MGCWGLQACLLTLPRSSINHPHKHTKTIYPLLSYQGVTELILFSYLLKEYVASDFFLDIYLSGSSLLSVYKTIHLCKDRLTNQCCPVKNTVMPPSPPGRVRTICMYVYMVNVLLSSHGQELTPVSSK